MEIIIKLQKQDSNRITMKHFLDVVERFNTDKTSARIKRISDDDFEIIITPKENIFKDCGIKHFDKFQDYKEWLWRKK